MTAGGDPINTFEQGLLQGLSVLELGRRSGEISRSDYFRLRAGVFERMEEALLRAGLYPWQLYLSIFTGTGTPGYRSTAINRLHDPSRVPEDAAQSVADGVVKVMMSPELAYGLGLQTFMAAGILRSHKPPGLMLPIPQTDIERYV